MDSISQPYKKGKKWILYFFMLSNDLYVLQISTQMLLNSALFLECQQSLLKAALPLTLASILPDEREEQGKYNSAFLVLAAKVVSDDSCSDHLH